VSTPTFRGDSIRADSVRPSDSEVTEKTPISWGRVFRYLLPYWKAEFALLGGMTLGIGLSLVYPLLMREIVNDVIPKAGLEGNTDRLLPLAGLILATTAGGILLSGAAAWLQTWVTARVLVDLRIECFRHLNNLGPAFFARRRLGDILSRMGGDLAELQSVATGTLINVIGSIITLIAVTSALTVLQPRLLLICAVFLPVAVVLMLSLRPIIRRLSLRIRERNADISHHMVENFTALRTIKAHGLTERSTARFLNQNNAIVRAVLTLRLWNAGSGGAFQLLVTTNLLAVIVVGVGLVSDGQMTVGDLVAFAMFQQRFYGPLQGLAGTYIGLQRAAAPVGRVFEILDAKPLWDASGTKVPEPFDGSLHFEQVSFNYGPGRPVLEQVDFTVGSGETVAIVGPSGVGKTTLLDLCFGFLPPASGRVILGGIPLSDLDLDVVLPQIAMVSQQPALFDASLRDNLRWLEPSLDDDAILEAAGRVALSEFIESLPEGLDTEVGDRGVRLSEGQRQRIGLARALLRDPALLVLDEVTAALDWESDRLIVEALGKRRATGRATLVVSHRLNLAAGADKVVVMEGGRVVQQGPHSELIATEGLYRRLWDLQRGEG
jgi:ATP-binding cassette subfamily B protein